MGRPQLSKKLIYSHISYSRHILEIIMNHERHRYHGRALVTTGVTAWPDDRSERPIRTILTEYAAGVVETITPDELIETDEDDVATHSAACYEIECAPFEIPEYMYLWGCTYVGFVTISSPDIFGGGVVILNWDDELWDNGLIAHFANGMRIKLIQDPDSKKIISIIVQMKVLLSSPESILPSPVHSSAAH